MNKLKTNSTANITYSGQVTLTSKRGSQILKTKTYHNQGLPKLFEGLSALFTCDGEKAILETASAIIPHYIALYTFSSNTYATQYPPSDIWSNLSRLVKEKKLERITPLITVDDAKVTEEGKITLQFKIASTRITSGSTVYLLALFPKTIDTLKDLEDSAIALYKLTKEDNGSVIWDEEGIITASTLLVEWQMSFGNAD